MSKESNGSPEREEMTFFEHIDALRPHLVRGVVVFLVVTLLAFFFKGFIIDVILFGPRSGDFITNRLLGYLGEAVGIEALRINTDGFNIVNTRMAGQFNLHIQVSVVTALVLAMPYMVWELWQFVKPALSSFERRRSNTFVLYVSLCFFAGVLFGYFLIAPLTINFLSGYTASEGITNMIDVGSYLSTILGVTLACGVLFELPILIYFLAKMGIVNSRLLKKYRRHAIVILLIISAVITPPDVMSQLLVVGPLILLYELSIKIAVRIEKGKKTEEMESFSEIYGNKIGE